MDPLHFQIKQSGPISVLKSLN